MLGPNAGCSSRSEPLAARLAATRRKRRPPYLEQTPPPSSRAIACPFGQDTSRLHARANGTERTGVRVPRFLRTSEEKRNLPGCIFLFSRACGFRVAKSSQVKSSQVKSSQCGPSRNLERKDFVRKKRFVDSVNSLQLRIQCLASYFKPFHMRNNKPGSSGRETDRKRSGARTPVPRPCLASDLGALGVQNIVSCTRVASV